jgi:hypothetical protein
MTKNWDSRLNFEMRIFLMNYRFPINIGCKYLELNITFFRKKPSLKDEI